MKKLLKNLLPPVVFKWFKKIKERSWKKYPTWEAAVKDSIGYGDEKILEKVKASALKVKNGEAAYERDSVIFDEIAYSWPVLAALLWVASRNGNKLNILDFGGSLGSSYFQNRKFLEHLDEFHWNIVEQKNFIACGKKYLEDERLKFFYTFEECLAAQKINVILLSSVLSYLEKPYELLEKIIKNNISLIIIDRSVLRPGQEDEIIVQKVPKKIYEANYPRWILGREKLLTFILDKYELIANFKGMPEGEGFVFKLKI